MPYCIKDSKRDHSFDNHPYTGNHRHIYANTSIHIHTRIQMNMNIPVHVPLHTYIYTYRYMYVCLYVYIYIRIYVYTYICICIYVCVYTHIEYTSKKASAGSSLPRFLVPGGCLEASERMEASWREMQHAEEARGVPVRDLRISQ